MSYYLDWPEEFNEYTRAITLRPRTKNGYPQDFTLSVAVRDGQAVFTATALSFWEQRDGRPYDREPIARGYVDVVAYESCEEYAGNSAAPALIGWDIADLYPARMALIRALCEGIASSITMGTQILADGQVQVDHKDGDLLALHVNAISTVGGMVRALIIEQDRVPSGVSTGTTTGASERADLQTRAYYANVLSPVPGEFGNLVWSHSEDAEYYPYRPTRHKPIFHAPQPAAEASPGGSGTDGAPARRSPCGNAHSAQAQALPAGAGTYLLPSPLAQRVNTTLRAASLSETARSVYSEAFILCVLALRKARS